MKEKIIKFIKSNGIFILVMAAIVFINFKYDRYFIMTGSMEPDYPIGTIVFIDPDTEPDKGDVCAYQFGNNVVIHRVDQITEEGYITKGDNNPSPDLGVVTKEEMIGKEAFHISVIAPLVRKLTGLS